MRKLHEDIKDQVFGRLTAIKPLQANRVNGRTYAAWDCLCSCGKRRVVAQGSLLSGATKSCGCLKAERAKENIQKRKRWVGHFDELAKDLIGRTFGRLAVKEYVRDSKGRMKLLCSCACGVEKSVAIADLRHDKVRSCGCLSRTRNHVRRMNKLDPNEAAWRQIFMMYRVNAKKRGLEFTLSGNEFKHLMDQPCYLCGDPPAQVKRYATRSVPGPSYVYNGIDRVDNAKGYTLDNSMSCCGVCNTAKHVQSLDDFLCRVGRIHNRHNTVERSAGASAGMLF